MNQPAQILIETDRLRLSLLEHSDAGFILELFNSDDFIHYIGDRNIRTIDDAKAYIDETLNTWYRPYQVGMFKVSTQKRNEQTVKNVGVCGLLKRNFLEAYDLGYALLPEFYGNGYAREASKAVIEYAENVLDQKQVWAFSDPANRKSIDLLEALGFRYTEQINISSDKTPNIVNLFLKSFQSVK